MKKVAFFTEMLVEDFDGAARTMFQLINRINPNDYAYFFVYGVGPETFRNFQSHKVPTLKIPVNEDYAIALPQLAKKKIALALDDFQPDVIHIATPSILGFFALKYAKSRNIPVISIYHTHFISYIAYYLRNLKAFIRPTEQWMQRTMQRFYNNCERVYVPTRNIELELQRLGIEKDKLQIWQRGIDCELFNPKKRSKVFIENLTLNNKPNILFASRLVWEKNIQTLIEVYKLLEQEGMPYNFIIAGEGAAKNQAMEEMPEAIFLGKLSHQELSILYASADTFIFPSISETYGNVIIEAMASGLPCIIANGGGSSSLVEHGRTGYKCSPNNAKEYVHYLHKILNHERAYQQIQEAGLRYARLLDWDALAETYFEEIELLAGDKRKEVIWAAS
ncbi:glycosyltransferase [Sphingobacterium sp. DK4209]|uniref:Glycosyltransferase n=1 Tax=Sphingobacterium zhuxiongii TaxID=2662364 RepID=A0A5Q0Q6B6_9SPHI|nr:MULTISPECIES: glycosyltransferase family 1 protein [unclassified Sphingobacterium]MVZ64265.1 glycosyltransferase [Sphingobacterium sp. DK4209]QGA25615.1 glycosyltransferase [Sphingobacterium sp. dk4302]